MAQYLGSPRQADDCAGLGCIVGFTGQHHIHDITDLLNSEIQINQNAIGLT